MSAKKSTRETKFNSYTEGDYINSVADITATGANLNLRLLNFDSYIYKTGKDLNDYSKMNNTYKYFKKEAAPITTGLADNQECYIFGSPMKTVLDNLQQYNNCGSDSILNNLALAGIKTITDQNKIETVFTKNLWELGLVDDSGKMGVFDSQDGGTDPLIYKEIFEYYGLNSEEHFGEGDEPTTDILAVANYVGTGRSAIVGVSSELLWYGDKAVEENIGIDHAITVTGVVYDTNTPVYDIEDLDNSTVPIGFFIHDTGGWITRYISYDEFEKVTLNDKLEVEGVIKEGIFATLITDIIKQNTDNINAVGTNTENIIYGNNSNNVIKGLGGNDCLTGSAGNDTIYGGAGDDILYGNGVVKDEYEEFIDNNEIKTRIANLGYVISKAEDLLFIGRNFLYGGSGNDYLFGGEYNDTLEGGAGSDYLFGGGGIDAIKGGSGNDYIYGGSGNDRLLGDAGDDHIEGGDGRDTIIGGSGNDTIIGGKGEDVIECGSGNDTVIFEKGCELDTVKSSSGSTVLKFHDDISDVNITDLKISLVDKSSKIKNLSVTFSNETDGLLFDSFYNFKKNSSKKVYIQDDVHEDAYRISVTKSKGKIKVANTKGNNVLISTSEKNNTITTGKGNDIVYMTAGNDIITYTSGEDYYFSDQGNNTYNVNNFDKDSFLSINDCTDIDGKTDSEGEHLHPSKDDVLNIKNNTSDELAIFFDVDSTGKIADTSLYILNKNEITITSDYLLDVLDNDTTGMIQIKDYFVKANPTTTSNYKGFGCIETITVCGEESDTDTYVKQIVSGVVSWLDGKDYTSVSDAMERSADNISDLIKIYTSIDL